MGRPLTGCVAGGGSGGGGNGDENLTVISTRGQDKGQRSQMKESKGLQLATQRCAQAGLGSGWRMPGKPSSGVGRLVVTEDLVDTVPLPSLSRRPACQSQCF